MRLAILTAFWQRPDVSRIWWAGMVRLREAFRREGVVVQVYAGISPGDAENAALAHQHGDCTVIQAPNRPLAAKLNALSTAARDTAYCLLIDSDDVLSNGMAGGYARLMRDGVPFTGLADCYVHDLLTGRVGYFPGVPTTSPRAHMALCVGRLWSRDVAQRLEWRFWPSSQRLRGMGWLAAERLRQHGVPLASVRCEAVGGYALGLKGRTNLWGYNTVALQPADKAVLDAFPELVQVAQCA